MSEIERLTKALQVASRDWAEVEAGASRPVPAVSEIQFAAAPPKYPGTANEPGLATFRLTSHEPWLGQRGHREYVVTITESGSHDG